MFPYSLLIMAMMMYLPALIWRFLAMPSLGSDLLFIIDELDKSYNRSILIAQSIVELRDKASNPLEFSSELERSGQLAVQISLIHYSKYQNSPCIKLYILTFMQFNKDLNRIAMYIPLPCIRPTIVTETELICPNTTYLVMLVCTD